MTINQENGTNGEMEVCLKIPCPNCKKKLMTLPKNYPLFDLQCTGCSFRVQVKTVNSKPTGTIFGAGWDIMEKVLKSGYLIPSLIANFKWKENGKERQKIIFYPFIPKANISKRQLSPTARRANYKMFNYAGIDKLPHFILCEK